MMGNITFQVQLTLERNSNWHMARVVEDMHSMQGQCNNNTSPDGVYVVYTRIGWRVELHRFYSISID